MARLRRAYANPYATLRQGLRRVSLLTLLLTRRLREPTQGLRRRFPIHLQSAESTTFLEHDDAETLYCLHVCQPRTRAQSEHGAPARSWGRSGTGPGRVPDRSGASPGLVRRRSGTGPGPVLDGSETGPGPVRGRSAIGPRPIRSRSGTYPGPARDRLETCTGPVRDQCGIGPGPVRARLEPRPGYC